MKKRLAILALAAVLALAAALALFVRFGVDTQAFKTSLGQAVKRVSGLDLVVAGGVRFHFFPWLGVEVEDASLGGLPGAEAETFVRIRKLGLKVAPLPLLQKKIEAAGLVLDGLEVRLIRDVSGRLNVQAMAVEKVEVKKDMVEVTTTQGEHVVFSYLIDSIRCTDASVVFEDRMSGRSYRVEKLDVSTGTIVQGTPFEASSSMVLIASDPELRATVRLDGAVTVRPETLEFFFAKTRLAIDVAGKGAPFESGAFVIEGDVAINAEKQRFEGKNLTSQILARGGLFPKEGEKANFSGNLALDLGKRAVDAEIVKLAALGAEIAGTLNFYEQANAPPHLFLELKTNTFNPRNMLQRLGMAPPPCRDATALQSASLSLKASLGKDVLNIGPAELNIDGAPISVTASVAQDQDRRVSLQLKAGALDLDRYLPVKKEKQESKPATAGKNAAAPGDRLAPLRTLNADATVDIAALRVAKLKLTDFFLKISARGGQIECAPFRASLYQGRAQGTLKADVRAAIPIFNLEADVTGLHVQPLLTDLQGKSPITGVAALHAGLQARGLDSEALLSSLNGKAKAALVNGAILGFNFGPEQFMSKDKLLGAHGQQASTRFDSITASATIKDGVATNSDLLALIPPHKATGQGQADLGRMTVDYHAKAHFLNLATIPVKITGRLNSPELSLDSSNLATEVVKSGASLVKEAVKNPEQVKEKVNDVINFLGGKQKRK